MFEVYDDVAFYFLLCSLLAMFLFPPSIVLAIRALKKLIAGDPNSKKLKADPKDFGTTLQRLDVEPTFKEKYFKFKWLLFALGWLLFVPLATNLPKMQTAELASFKPFDILGLELEATEDQIKKAYRKLSLKWHPDKNKGDADAEEKFIMISKAYTQLTDPEKKGAFSAGRPDTETSFTIGLPSYLVRKENEMHILLFYFLLVIVLPPVAVFMWWRKASQMHETGAMRETIQLYFHFLQEHMATKFIIELLAASAEFSFLEMRVIPNQEQELKKLFVQVSPHMSKQKFNRKYIVKGNILLHCHLLRIPVPDIFKEDMKMLLKESLRLLVIMMDIAMAKKMIKPAMACIELSQWITQSLFSSENTLVQLPHVTIKEVTLLRRKGITSLAQFKELEPERKTKLLKDNTPQEIAAMDKFAAELPDVGVHPHVDVEDEEGIMEDDVVKLTFMFTRKGAAGVAIIKAEDDKEKAAKSLRYQTAREERNKKEAAKKALLLATKNEKSKAVAGLGIGGEVEEEKVEKAEGLDNESDSDYDSDDEEPDFEAQDREFKLLAELPSKEKAKKKDKDNARLVISPLFPFVKRERWTVFLFSTDKGTHAKPLLNLSKMIAFGDEDEHVVMYIRVGKAATYKYQVQALCDSYIGVNVEVNFTIKVDKMTKDFAEDRLATMRGGGDIPGEEDQDVDLDAGEPEGYWYYMGASSFWEMIINIIILGVMAFFGHNFLVQRGLWQKYVEPPAYKAYSFVKPAHVQLIKGWKTVYPTVAPVLDPLANFGLDMWSRFTSAVVVDEEEEFSGPGDHPGFGLDEDDDLGNIKEEL